MNKEGVNLEEICPYPKPINTPAIAENDPQHMTTENIQPSSSVENLHNSEPGNMFL